MCMYLPSNSQTELGYGHILEMSINLLLILLRCACLSFCLFQTLWRSAWSCFSFSLIFMVPEHLSEWACWSLAFYLVATSVQSSSSKAFPHLFDKFPTSHWIWNCLTTSIERLGDSHKFLCGCGSLVWPCDGNWCGHFRPDLPRKQHCANVLCNLSLWLQSVFISWMC